MSFYGDHCYNVFNHSFFNSYEKHLHSGNLFIIIGDPLHMMKNLKSRFLKCIISLDKSGTISFSLADLISTLGDDKQYLKDKTQLGAMRDGLALQLFDKNNILFLLQKGEFTIMMALLPMSLLQFSLRSEKVPLYWRVYSLFLCFWLVYYHYQTIKSRDKKIIGLTKNKNKKFCSFMSIIFLKRLMNTIICISLAIFFGFDSLCLDLLTPHYLELFFGLVRGFSKGIDGWETFYRTIGKTIMTEQSLNELNINPLIKHRANLAGIIINYTLDEKLFSQLSFDALRTAQGLFQYLLNRNDTSHIVYNFNNWITSMSTYFPVTKKCVNPTCGVKIISRIINASKNKKVDQDLYDDDDDESDDDTEENEDDQD